MTTSGVEEILELMEGNQYNLMRTSALIIPELVAVIIDLDKRLKRLERSQREQ